MRLRLAAGSVRQRLLWLAAALLLAACSGGEKYSAASFVGKWKSSRLTTPLHLYANGEWEIRQDDGAVLQYGVWQLKEKTFVWSFRTGDGILHDPCPVLSVKPGEFRLKESNGTTTTFVRLD